MADFRPLHDDSQATTRPVLYFDASAPVEDLLETMDYRIGVAYQLLRSLACASGSFSEDFGPSLAGAAAMLISDSMKISSACYSALMDYELARRHRENGETAPQYSSAVAPAQSPAGEDVAAPLPRTDMMELRENLKALFRQAVPMEGGTGRQTKARRERQAGKKSGRRAA